jgi:hypothetical protein
MSDLQRWRDSGHLERAVGTAGGQEAFDAGVSAMLKNARDWRLAELRQRPGITQEQVATRMGVSVADSCSAQAGTAGGSGCLSECRAGVRASTV